MDTMSALVAAADILVVEDDDDLRWVVVETLSGAGYSATPAANGKEALMMLAAPVLPRLVLTDLSMPVMDGRELIKAMRADERLRSIPVLVLSALEHDPLDPVLGPPLVTYLCKAGAPKLLKAVERRLGRRR